MSWPLARRRATDSPLVRGHHFGVLRAAVVALTVAGCIPGRHERIAPRRSPARDTLLVADLHRVDTLAARGILGTRSVYFAPEIVYLRAGAPAVFGRDAVTALLSSTPVAPMPVAWQPLGGGISLDALSGYTIGVAVYAPAENRPPGIGRYIAFWSRRRGGPWQISAYAEVGEASPVAMTPFTAGVEVPRLALSGKGQSAAAGILTADSDFADESAINGTAAAFADAVATDGVIFGGPELIVGPRAVAEFFQAQRGASLSWHPIYAFGAASGDLGFTIGESVATSRGQSGAAVQRFGKYLTVWRKEPNGKWKFVVDGGNSRPNPIGQ